MIRRSERIEGIMWRVMRSVSLAVLLFGCSGEKNQLVKDAGPEETGTKEIVADVRTHDAEISDQKGELPSPPDIIDASEVADMVQLDVPHPEEVAAEIPDIEPEFSDAGLEVPDLPPELQDAGPDLFDLAAEEWTGEPGDVSEEAASPEADASGDGWLPPDQWDSVDDTADGLASDGYEEGDGDEQGDGYGDIELAPFECAPSAGTDTDYILLSGQVLSHGLYLEQGQVLVNRTTERLVCVAQDCADSMAGLDPVVVCTDGIIMPGIVDAHNHVQYNYLPVWKHPQKFNNRYQWQANSGYKQFKKPHTMLYNSMKCEMTKWGEIRALVAGTTAITGSPGGINCINTVIRNTEEGEDSVGLPDENGVEYNVPAIGGLWNEVETLVSEIAGGSLEAFVPHLAEGIDESSRQEFDVLEEMGLLIPQTAIIHGTAGTSMELGKMAANFTKLIWSPQSNTDLYGLTARVTTALNLGVLVALAPDWTPNGTMNQLYELECADHLNQKYYGGSISDELLFDMVTVNAARALSLEDKLGMLKPDWYADITIIDDLEDTPHRSVIAARPENVQLVLVGGKPLYGDDAKIALFETEFCELLDVCGRDKTICVKTQSEETNWKFHQTLADVEAELTEALQDAKQEYIDSGDYTPGDALYQFELLPLFSCENKVHWCDFGTYSVSGAPSQNDSDGDDVMNGEDNCPDIFNPEQSDMDLDEVGDACDPCPSDPDTTDCEPLNPTDIDGDGIGSIEDNCPSTYNPDQEDGDGDDKGDVCDLCPDFPNPGIMGCPTPIYEISDEFHPLHPDEGTSVHIPDVVVTAIAKEPGSSANGFWVQEQAGGQFSGLYVYMGGNDPPPAELQVGQLVSVSGTYIEYWGMAELKKPEITIVNPDAALVPVPVLLTTADLCTDTDDAEGWEGVLVRIEDVAVTDPNPDAPWDYDEFEVDGCYRVDDYIFGDLVKPVEGSKFEYLQGIQAFAFSNFKIFPRGVDDYAITP